MVHESDLKKMKIKYMERDIGVLVEIYHLFGSMYHLFLFIYIYEIVLGNNEGVLGVVLATKRHFCN